MKNTKLNKSAAQAAVNRWLKQENYAKTKSGRRLQVLLEHMNEKGEVNLQTVIDELFEDVANPLNSISKLSKDVEQKAKAINLNLSIVKDNVKGADWSKRTIWLKGDDVQTAKIVQEQREAIKQPESTIKNLAVLHPQKEEIGICVCFAEKEMEYAEELVEKLEDNLAVQQKYQVNFKLFTETLFGVPKEGEILENLINSDFLLLLESPKFYNDKDIKKYLFSELDLFEVTAPLPICLVRILDNADRRNLTNYDPFCIINNGKQKTYQDLRKAGKNEFAQSLVADILQRLDNYIPINKQRKPIDLIKEKWLPRYKKEFIANYGMHVRDLGSYQIEQKGTNTTAIDLLTNWVQEGETPLFALLGQYGMGKTFTSKVFTNRQIELFEEGKTKYLPIYFDLRYFDIRVLEKLNFEIWDIVESILEKRKEADDDHPLTKDEVREIWKNQDTLLIFDGLDEVITHISNRKIESDFIYQIFQLIPNYQSKITNVEKSNIKRKMLLTCRTDYFKNLSEQTNFFLRNSRQYTDAKNDYDCCILLPFNTDQIKEYLQRTFPDKDSSQLYQTLENIHNLAELSQRPVLLDFLSEIIDDLEQLILRNETVTTATIYELMVNRSFDRDKAKHEIPTEIKVRLLEEIAALLWRRSTRSIVFEELAEFLGEYLDGGTAAMRKLYYQKDELHLYKDLRNATLLTRGNSDKDFGFSHTSIQEYFLARYIFSKIEMGAFEKLDLVQVSTETLDFVLDLLKTSKAHELQRFNQQFQIAFQNTSPNCRRLLFELYLKDQKRDTLLMKPQPLNLSQLDFHHYDLAGSPDRPLDLRHANFQHSKIHQSTWKHLQLDYADFSHSWMRNVHFRALSMNHSNFSNADIQGWWRKIAVQNLQVKAADFSHSHLIKTAWTSEKNFKRVPYIYQRKANENLNFHFKEGHSNWVRHCQIIGSDKALSCSDDNSLILWDLNSGKIIHRLEGHSSAVNHCQIIGSDKALSCSSDNSLILWDVEQGKKLKQFYHLNHRSAAVIGAQQELLDYTKEAWQSLYAEDAETRKYYHFDEVV